MTTEKEKLEIKIGAEFAQINAANTALKNLKSSLTLAAKEIEVLKKGFKDSFGVLKTQIATLRQFDKQLQQFSKGDYFTRSSLAALQLAKNVEKAGNALQVLRLKENNVGPYNVSSGKQQILAKELQVGEARLAAEADRTNSSLRKRLQFREKELEQLRQSEASYKKQVALEQQIANMKARAVSPEFQKAQRQLTESRVLGDGGASLFKIQASLLVNYTLMNQIFNLFSFGSQFVLELESSFKQLQAITASTNTEMEGLQTTIIDVSKNTRFSAVEVAQAATILGQAGFSAREINNSIQGVALLATATGTDLATSVDVASSAVSIFQLRSEDMNRVANVLTGALNETKLTMDKVALGLQYAGNIASQAGLGFEETVAVLGAMSNAGIRSGSTLGTGLRQILVELLDPSEKFREKLEKVGLNIDDVDVKSKGFVGVMQTLRDAGFNTADAFESFEVRSAAAFAAIQNNPEIITELTQSFIFSSAAAQANEVQMESLAAKFDVLRNNVGVAAVEFSGPFVSALKIVTDGATVLVSTLTSLASVLSVIGTGLIGLGLSFGAVKIGGLLKNLITFSAVSTTITNIGLAGSIASIGSAAFKVLGPVSKLTIAFTALTTVADYFYESQSEIAAKLDEVKGEFDRLSGAYDSTQQAINSVDTESEKLINRMVQLKKSPDEVYNTMLLLTRQFKDFGFEVTDVTNPSIEALIESLNKLKGSLQATSVAQLELIEGQRLLVAFEQARKINSNSDRGFQEQFSSFASQSRVTGQAASALSGINTRVADNTSNLDGLTQADYKLKRDFVVKEIANLDKLRASINKYLLELEKSGQKGSAVYTALSETSKRATKSYEDINQQAALINSFIISVAQGTTETFKLSTLSETIDKEFQRYNIQLAEITANTKGNPEETEQKVLALNAELTATINDLISNQMGTAIDFLKSQGQEVGPQQIDSLKSQVFTKLNQTVEEGKNTIDKATTSTGKAINEALEAAKNGLETIQGAYEAVSRPFDQKLSEIDAIIAEASDEQRGGLRGKVSQVELEVLRDQQKQIQTQKLKAQLDQGPQRLAGLDRLISEQRIDSKKGNAQERLSSERELNNLLNERAQLESEIAISQAQYNAMTGQATINNMELSEQLGYVLRNYGEQQQMQSQWSYNLQTNVIDQLDNAKDAFGEFVSDTVIGTKSISDSFRDMATNILQSLLKMTTNKLAGQIFGSLDIGSFFGLGGGGGSGVAANASSLTGGGTLTLNGGGFIKANSGTYIGRDNIPVLAQEGEYILRRGAVGMLGKENLDQLNAMGNRSVSSNPLTSSSVDDTKNSQSTVLNVYVVSPDQKPSLTKNDVIVTISEDLMRGGNTKKLIKTIMAGQ